MLKKSFYALAITALLTAPIAANATVAGDSLVQATASFLTQDGISAGQAKLTEGPNGVLIHLDLENITPGPHGLHLHDIGDCSPHGELGQNESHFQHASGHFNPKQVEHGFLNANGLHAGDFPNIFVPENGKLKLDIFAPELSLKDSADRMNIMDSNGSALMIHAKADDYTSPDTGDAGARLACAVVQ